MSNPKPKNLFAKNAVLFKDMSIDIKRPKILIFMMIFNFLVMTVVAGFFLYITISGLEGEMINYRALAIMLIALIGEETGILFMVAPALTASSVSGERERQTLDVLLTTRMTPFEIVIGKYLSALTQGILLVISTLPFLSLVFIYGGLNFFQLLGLLAVLIYEIAFISVFGVFFSSLTKHTVPAVILSYVMLGILVGGTLSAFGAVYAIGELINEQLHPYHYGATTTTNLLPEIHFDFAIFFLLINPVATIFDCIGSILGVEIDDVAFKGMKTIVDMNYIDGKNPLIIAWTPISMVLQGLIGFGFLRLAGACLNPVRNNKKRERDYDRRNMKKVGVQPDVKFEEPAMPMQEMVPPTPGGEEVPVQENGAIENIAVPNMEAVPESAASANNLNATAMTDAAIASEATAMTDAAVASDAPTMPDAASTFDVTGAPVPAEMSAAVQGSEQI